MDPVQLSPGGSSPSKSSLPGSPSPEGTGPGGGGDQDNPAPKKAAARKRTKTGCLTCRKRRIKCDEGKPTCNNCIKSKRPCEGYTQRLTFKEPLNSFQHAALFGHHPVFTAQAPELVQVPIPPPPQAPKVQIHPGPLPAIAPKPPSVDFTGGLPFQPYSGQPGSAASSQSPTAFSPQHQMGQSPFMLSPDSGVGGFHPQFPQQDFYNIISPTQTRNGSAGYEQLSPLSERWQSQGSRHGSLPTPVEEEPAASASAASDGLIYWHSDDEASMAESEDEEILNDMIVAEHLKSNDLGIQVARRMPEPVDVYSTHVRTHTGSVDENMLETYSPSSSNSPLNDAQTASIFWYFVNVTAPSMSLYERHPFDSAPLFQGQPVPKTNQHIWTYTFPIIAFNHPGLLQAILALGSLQMAKLHNMPPTASMKHYHLSLRRLAKNYQSTTRRTQPATLAATLLLGFYEVWNSDHDKWCKHMWGARAILKEIPLRQMTRDILALKRRHRRQVQESRLQQMQHDGFSYSQPDMPDIDMVNTALLSQLTGHSVNYDDFGQVYGSRSSHRRYTERDIETYEHLSDLFWWYCKMDVYQSVLGGAKLFMDYELWTQCAPRAPFARLDAIYGTFDHLMLLLGRMANFASRDLSRKRKAKKADPNAPKGPGGPGQSPPMFPGLVPANANVAVPTGFSPPREHSPPLSDVMEDLDIEASTVAALQEWESIRHAFEIFRAHLGADFEPLGPDLSLPEQTPFGPSQTYRTYSIAGIWMNYYMGLIALYRAHPSMPPIAMVAAGMAAKQTMPWALEIGRIAAGVHEDLEGVPAFQTMPQRHWTIKRLHHIARLTGWQSARQIANGCESAWTKAAAMGRGPPYQRPPELEKQYPPSVWANPRRIDRRIQEVDGDNNRVVLAKTERAHYALGLLGVEQDLENLVLQDDN
ncbi:hypothetical protein GQ53DRAFT_782857 [Thozetella sp. PMI_491]|nr:hypothetical protein GQ53DRAFT_782857 [Thozetella sp. PMI_491]